MFYVLKLYLVAALETAVTCSVFVIAVNCSLSGHFVFVVRVPRLLHIVPYLSQDSFSSVFQDSSLRFSVARRGCSVSLDTTGSHLKTQLFLV